MYIKLERKSCHAMRHIVNVVYIEKSLGHDGGLY